VTVKLIIFIQIHKLPNTYPDTINILFLNDKYGMGVTTENTGAFAQGIIHYDIYYSIHTQVQTKILKLVSH
jgi:hypothetical protein